MTQPPTPPYGDRPYDRVDPYIDPVGDSVATETWTTGTDETQFAAGPESESGTKDTAKQEAVEVKDTAVQAGQQVAGTAKEQAQNVASEAGQQTKQLWQETVSQLGDQASGQQQRLAGTLTSFSKELGSMASSSNESGLMTDLAHQASRRGGEIAHWLENREPKDLLEDVKSFARRRPFAFLAIAATAGVVAGRLTRGLSTNAKADHEISTSTTESPALDAGGHQEWTVPAEPARESLSLEEIPTSGSGTGPSYYDPTADPTRLGNQGGVR